MAFWMVAICRCGWAYEVGKFYWRGETKEKVIALTFDDGPGPWTPQILDVLKKHNIRATFFMEGSQVERYPEIARQVVQAGHEIGNHTYAHFDYHKVDPRIAPARLEHEIKQTEASLWRVAQVKPVILRMPHGYYNKTWLLPLCKKLGYSLVHWSYGDDWHLKLSEDEMAKGYLAGARPGAVFLFHDGGRKREKTYQALQKVLAELQAQGFRFVPAEALFR